MAKFILDFGREVDILTKGELDQSLADAQQRAIVAGVKAARFWANSGTIGAAQVSYSTPPLVASGYVWAIMNIGVEMSASANCLVYLMGGANAAGGNRFVGIMPTGGSSRSLAYSKGQLMLNTGEFLTIAPASGNILSVFISAIEVPAERAGELLL